MNNVIVFDVITLTFFGVLILFTLFGFGMIFVLKKKQPNIVVQLEIYGLLGGLVAAWGVTIAYLAGYNF